MSTRSIYSNARQAPHVMLAKLACLMPLGPAQSSKKSSMKRVRMARRLGPDLPVPPSHFTAPPAAAAAAEAVELVAPGPDAASCDSVGPPSHARKASGPAWHRGCQNKHQHTRTAAVHTSHEARGTVTTSKARELKRRLPYIGNT